MNCTAPQGSSFVDAANREPRNVFDGPALLTNEVIMTIENSIVARVAGACGQPADEAGALQRRKTVVNGGSRCSRIERIHGAKNLFR